MNGIKKKERVTFQVPGETEFYMAGFYQKYGEEGLLRNPYGGLPTLLWSRVHDRMPLILTKEQVEPLDL